MRGESTSPQRIRTLKSNENTSQPQPTLKMGPSRSNHSTATAKRSPGSSSHTKSTTGPSTGRRLPPQRTKSDDVNLRHPPQLKGRNPPPRGRSLSPSRTQGTRRRDPSSSFRPQQQRGRSRSPSNQRGLRGRSTSAERPGQVRGRPMNNPSGHSRGPPPMRRSGHSRSPMASYSGHSRTGYPVGNQSGHSRSGHTTIFNSRHSRNGDRSAHSMMSSRSGHSRTRSGSRGRPSLADQHMTKNRKKRIYQSLRNVTKRQFPWSRCCSYFIPVFVLLAAAIGLLFATGNGGNASAVVPPDDESLDGNTQVEDPFHGKNPIAQWTTDGSGLKVTILNALDEAWGEILDLAVEDWEFGNPDAITISVQKEAADNNCEQKEGMIKVCNGNYGDTKWRGFTELQLDASNGIAAATIKLNDFYLNSMSKNARQYTLCHEFGKIYVASKEIINVNRKVFLTGPAIAFILLTRTFAGIGPSK